MADVSPLVKARVAGVFCLLTFITGISALGRPGQLGSNGRPRRRRVLSRVSADQWRAQARASTPVAATTASGAHA